MNARFQATVYGTFFALAIGWVLYIGKGVFVPIVFSVLVVYVIVGLARMLVRLPLVGRFLPPRIGYPVSALVIALSLAAIASLVAGSIGNVSALAPKYAASMLNAIQSVAERLGVELAPTWATLRQDVLAQINTQRLIGSTVVSVSAIVSTLVVVLLYVVFLLIEQRTFSTKIARISSDPQNVLQIQKIIAQINARIGAYLALKTVVSVIQCLVSWAVLEFIGVEFAAFWAVFIGMLNYVTYLGSVWASFSRCVRDDAVCGFWYRAGRPGVFICGAVRDRVLSRSLPDGQFAESQPLRHSRESGRLVGPLGHSRRLPGGAYHRLHGAGFRRILGDTPYRDTSFAEW
jgi:predicted PurR-regulated permease PerM